MVVNNMRVGLRDGSEVILNRNQETGDLDITIKVPSFAEVIVPYDELLSAIKKIEEAL